MIKLQAFRLVFVAQEGIYFPEGHAANILRGAFGTILRKLACDTECESAVACNRRASCAYAMLFEPRSSGAGPSGLRDWPRPFVFRASHLDGKRVDAGGVFSFDFHLFDLKTRAVSYLIRAFAELAREGLGGGRKRVELMRVEGLCGDGSVCGVVHSETDAATIEVPLDGGSGAERRLVVRFVTPTELKSESRIVSRPEFGILAGRIRDRVSVLCELYGDGAPGLDFKGFGERAAAVQMTRCEVRTVEVERRSSRTAQSHSIGGFVGEAVYEGEVGEFVPWLRAAHWTGVGRQTVWGKGLIEVDAT